MTEIASATPAERLRLYRTRHRIEIDRSGDWTTCETDGLKVYPVRGRQWRHDQDQIRRLELASYASPTDVSTRARELLDQGTAAFERQADLNAIAAEGEAIYRDLQRENTYYRAHQNDTENQFGEACWKAGHAFGCPCRAGGDVELKPGWIAFEGADGDLVEVETT